MKQINSADDLAKDVAGAEALLERHQEHKGEIDAREDSFKLISDSGSSLVERNHFAASEVAEKLNSVSEEKIGLLSLWEDRRVLYEQCMDLQLFYRDTEQADTWMAKEAWIREKEPIASSNNRGRDLIGVQNVIKKHQAVLSEICNHEARVNSVCEAGSSVSDGGGYMADEVGSRVGKLRDHWNALRDKADKRKRDLDDALLVRMGFFIFYKHSCQLHMCYASFNYHMRELIVIVGPPVFR